MVPLPGYFLGKRSRSRLRLVVGALVLAGGVPRRLPKPRRRPPDWLVPGALVEGEVPPSDPKPRRTLPASPPTKLPTPRTAVVPRAKALIFLSGLPNVPVRVRKSGSLA